MRPLNQIIIAVITDGIPLSRYQRRLADGSTFAFRAVVLWNFDREKKVSYQETFSGLERKPSDVTSSLNVWHY